MAPVQPRLAQNLDVPVRGLIIREPWLSMILAGRKDWEMRSRSTTVRGSIALIRSGSGLVVGVARLTGCGERLAPEAMRASNHRHGVPAERIDRVIADGWTIPWQLEGARALSSPLPYRHPKGAVVWVRLDPEVVSEMVAACPATGYSSIGSTTMAVP